MRRTLELRGLFDGRESAEHVGLVWWLAWPWGPPDAVRAGP
jgi:hypothetical protein